MPSETLHSSHLAYQPSETLATPADGGAAPPVEVSRRKAGRVSITAEDVTMQRGPASADASPYDRYVLGAESSEPLPTLDELGAEVADLHQENDALRLQVEELKRQVAELKGEKLLAVDQPRRVRKQAGVTERLVKYADGSFAWETVSVDPEITRDTSEDKPDEPAEQAEHGGHRAEGGEAEAHSQELVLTAQTGGAQAEASEAGAEKSADADRESAPAASFEVLIPAELQAELARAQDAYAAAVARERNGFLGHVLQDSQVLIAIPGLQKLASRLNESHDATHGASERQAYKEVVTKLQEEIRAQSIAARGAEQEVFESIRMATMDVALQSEVNLEIKIAAARMEQSGKTNKFINWWVRQDGLGGKIRKGLTVGAAGVTTGVLLGIAGAPLVLGAVAGGALSAGIGGYVTKKRASGLTEKGGTQTLAEQQQHESIRAKNDFVTAQKFTDGGYADATSLVDMTEADTARETVGNRGRLRNSILAGVATGAAGAGLGELARSSIDQAGDTSRAHTPDTPRATESAPEPSPAPGETPSAPELQGTNFTVEAGNGYTHELIDFARANGRLLTPEQSLQLHQDIVNQFGSDYINIGATGGDVYTQAGEVRLAAPGNATWANGVSEYIQQWMAGRGLW